MKSAYQLLRVANNVGAETKPLATATVFKLPTPVISPEGIEFNFGDVVEVANVEVWALIRVGGVDKVIPLLPAALAVQANKKLQILNIPAHMGIWCTFSATVASKDILFRYI